MNKSKENDNQLTVPGQEETAVSTEVSGFAAFAGSGFENQTKDDYLMPMIKLLQGLSPECKPSSGIPDARPGKFFNTVTNEVYDSFTIVPVATDQKVLEWIPRNNGGGLAAVYNITDPIVQNNPTVRNSKVILENGNELMQTFYVFALMVDAEGNTNPVVIPFSSTKISKYKAWMTMARSLVMKLSDGRKAPFPLFAHRYKVTSVEESNKKGEFSNMAISFDGKDAAAARLDEKSDIVKQAMQLKKQIDAGNARVDHEAAGSTSDNVGGDELPF